MNEIFNAYNLVPGEFGIEAFGNGLINQTWRIKNANNDFILQRINDAIFKRPDAIASNVKRIVDYLSAGHPGYLLAAPVKTQTNEEMVFIAGQGHFRLIPFIQGSHTVTVARNPGEAYEAAKKFGEFTRLLSGFPVDTLEITIPDFHNLSLRYEQFATAMEKGNRERLQQSHDLIDFLKANKNIVDTYWHILFNPEFKRRVTHHDTKISNVLFDKDDNGLCVIDLDTVMSGYFFSDVGDMIRTYVSSVSEEEIDFSKINIREDFFTALYKGYMNEMKDILSGEEKAHFIYAGKFMIYMQAIRFLTDYLNDDIYYGARYKDHNLVRAGNQAILLKRLMEKEDDLKFLIS